MVSYQVKLKKILDLIDAMESEMEDLTSIHQGVKSQIDTIRSSVYSEYTGDIPKFDQEELQLLTEIKAYQAMTKYVARTGQPRYKFMRLMRETIEKLA